MPLYSVVHEPASPIGTIVFCHGLGSDERDLLELGVQVAPNWKVVSLRAPYSYGLGGYSWFDVQFQEDGSRRVDLQQAETSRDEICRFLAELRASTPKLVLGGFSQGAMMTVAVLRSRPELAEGWVVMSGLLLPLPASAPVVGERVLVQHGTYDPLLFVDEGRKLARVLSQEGADVEFLEYPFGHQVSLESMEDAQSWLHRLN